MKNKIYIIADTENINIYLETIIRKVESKLIEIGYEIINPIDKFLDKGISLANMKKKKLIVRFLS